jgi:hypothetical protein
MRKCRTAKLRKDKMLNDKTKTEIKCRTSNVKCKLDKMSPRTGHLGQESLFGTAGTGQPRNDRPKRIERAVHPGQDSSDRTVETGKRWYCSRSRRRAANRSKRMYRDYTHGLFIT